MKKEPQPRKCVYFGMYSPASFFEKGTWIEAEEMTYPSGSMKRRARALNVDTGKIQVIKCGLPDTWFSIVAGGGFLTICDDPENENYKVLLFHPYKKE